MKEKLNKKLVECPECLGLGVEYQPEIEEDQVCKLCKGNGKVTEDVADTFDPLSLIKKEKEEIDDEEFDY